MVCGQIHVGARLGDRLPVVERLQFRKLLGVFVDGVGDVDEDLLALAGTVARPRRVEGVPRGVDGTVDVCLRRATDGREYLTRRRVDRVDGATLRRLDELAADVEVRLLGDDLRGDRLVSLSNLTSR